MKHITQTTPNNCTSTCLAMLTGLPVEQVTAEFNERWHDPDVSNREHNPFTYLCSKGYAPILICSPYDNAIYHGTVMLLTVPSLNVEGVLHHVLMRSSIEQEVYDPAKGREGRRFYTYEERDPKGVELKSWLVDLYLPLHEAGNRK